MKGAFYNQIYSKRGLVGVLFCIIHFSVLAQQFDVRTFRLLPNDITAYINPVRDLNQEACALIKVVGNPNFVFSTPLGVVERRNDVGETWLYIPHGSVLLTIKHPQWGVLRDYRFPTPLESRMTYELVLTTPIVASELVISPIKEEPIIPDTISHCLTTLSAHPMPAIKRPREPLRYLLLGSIGFNKESPSFGIRMGMMRRHGAYLLLQGDFHAMPNTQGRCNQDGAIIDENENKIPYYTGHTESGRMLFLAGGMHRVAGGFCLYEGIGYGKHLIAWETTEGMLMHNTYYSSQGISAEAGAIWRFKNMAFSAGVLTIAANYWEATVGIGIVF